MTDVDWENCELFRKEKFSGREVSSIRGVTMYSNALIIIGLLTIVQLNWSQAGETAVHEAVSYLLTYLISQNYGKCLGFASKQNGNNHYLTTV